MATPKVCMKVEDKWAASLKRLNRSQPGIVGLLSFSEAWILAKDFLYPRDLSDSVQKPNFSIADVKHAVSILGDCNVLHLLMDDFLEDMRQQSYLIKREIEQIMSKYEASSDPQYIAKLIIRLVQWYKAWEPISELGGTLRDAYTLAFQTHTYSALPSSFAQGFRGLLVLSFRLTHQATVPEWLLTLAPPVNIPGARIDLPLWDAIDTLGLLERYSTLVAEVCHEQIEAHILETCTKKWDEPMLVNVRSWMADNIVPWLLTPFAKGARTPDAAKKQLQSIGTRLDFHVCQTLCDLRIREIFDIIIDHPDSAGALQDLNECLQRVDHRAQLVQTLRKANKRRLLHPGADTKDILMQYVSIIRCLRVVDPQGVLLYKVADPIRRYLRERPDTIRCIVASLVGDHESGDSLVDENDPKEPVLQPMAEDYTDQNWEPEPIDAGPEFRTNKPGDIIGTLVSIYDSKDLFVKELQVLLAQRLLAITDGNFTNERRNIEVLKARFGDAALQVCEVMLKDMTDSRRIDQHVQSQKSSVLHPTIISKHFWPSLQSSTFVMPGQLKQIQDEYAKEFTAFKPDKKLAWLPHLGTVKLELELDDRTIEVDVPPLEAAFIELFSEKETWTMDELIAKVGSIDRMMALKALTTWVDHGVLQEDEPERFRLLTVKEDSSRPKASGSRSAMLMDEAPAVAFVQQQEAEQMRVFWKYIEGMLKNLGTLPLDRIQQMLKFAPGYDRNIDQLSIYMEAARREGLVTVRDGMWRLYRQ